MRSKLLESVTAPRDLNYRYRPTLIECPVNVSGLNQIKSVDPVEFMSQYRVNDFKLQTMLDAGVDPSSIKGVSLLPLDVFDFDEKLSNVKFD